MSNASVDLVLDIETYEDIPEDLFAELSANIEPDRRLKDPQKIADDIRNKVADIRERAALSPLTGKVICAGVGMKLDGKWIVEQCYECHEPIDRAENGVLEWLSLQVSDATRLITFNGRRFDLPFLAARAMIHRVPLRLPVYGADRFSRHFDLCDVLPNGSLASWASRAFGVKKNTDDIAKLVRDGRWETILDRNAQDVLLTARLFDGMMDVARP